MSQGLHKPKTPLTMAAHQALAAAGIPAEEMDRHRVLVALACHPLHPQRALLPGLVQAACLGVQSAGGNPVAVDLPSAAGLPGFAAGWGAEPLAQALEAMGRGLDVKALVLLAADEESLEGLLLGAARLGKAAVALPVSAICDQGGHVALAQLARDAAAGKAGQQDWQAEMDGRRSEPGLGAPGWWPYGLHCLCEAAGWSLPHASLAPLSGSAPLGLARQSGWEAVALANLGRSFADLAKPANLKNAQALAQSLSLAPEALAALGRIAQAAGAEPPQGPDKKPAPAWPRPEGAAAWQLEGGVAARMARLLDAGFLDGSAHGVTRLGLKELLSELPLPDQADKA